MRHLVIVAVQTVFLPLFFALAVGSARRCDLYCRVEAVKAVGDWAGSEATVALRVVEETTQMPLRPMLGDVLWASSPSSVSDCERPLRRKLEVRHALRHIAAAVHAVNAVAQRRPACEDTSPRRRANGAAGMTVLHQDRAGPLGPLRHAWRVGSAVVPREIRPPCSARAPCT